MYSVEATAIIQNAFQVGFGYEINDNFTLNGLFHHGASAGKTSGPMLSPLMSSASNPYGAIPGSEVSYDMKTDLIMFGLSYTFSK